MKYKIEKNTVQETLIIPLYARKVCSELYPNLYRDETAVSLINEIDYDFSEAEKKFHSLMQRFGSLEVAVRQNDLAFEVKVQSFTDYEVVVTDDSQDGSVEEVVRRAEVPGMVYVRNAVRKGATGNWNEAVRHASGEYIKIMHHDDWFTDRDCLARFVEMLEEHPEADLAFCGSRQVMLDGVGNRMGEEFDRAISDEHLKMISEDWRDLYIGDYIGAPSATIYRKGAPEYEAVNFIEIDAGSFHNLACLNGPGSTLIRQVDVRPSGEAFFKIPLALSVPEEYQFISSFFRLRSRNRDQKSGRKK